FFMAGAIARIRPPVRFRPLELKLLQLQPCDASSLEDTATFEACFESQRRAWRALVKGLTTDAALFAGPWGSRLEFVGVPFRLYSSGWKILPEERFTISPRDDCGRSIGRLMRG